MKDEALPVAVNYYVENAPFLLDYFKEQGKITIPLIGITSNEKPVEEGSPIYRCSVAS